MPKPNGFILYQGPSRLDGLPIVVVATGFRAASNNAKTGSMLQTWILRADLNPCEVLARGADGSICGDCPHRSKAAGGTGACYVNVTFAPNGIYKAYHRGSYPVLQDYRVFDGHLVRLGAYGDPGAVPQRVWDRVMRWARAGTGYTHQWRTRPALRRWCMASVDSIWEAARARKAGWRTFRIRTAHQPLMAGEFECPASEEQGHRLDCAACMACDGHKRGARRASPAILVHGAAASSFGV